MFNHTIPHAEMPLPKPQVHAKHPFRDSGSHQKLMDYIRPRLDVGKSNRDERLPRMVSIDKNVAGWMRMSEDDKKRLRKQESTGVPQALTVSLPLNFVQMDDMMTYYAQTFAPNRGMFYQMGKPDEQTSANQIVTLMNNHAIYGGYFRQTLLTIFSTLKYNLGGFCCFWSLDQGPKLSKNDRQETVLATETVWQGNRVESLNMYNTFWDPSVGLSDLYRLGEWCARADIVSHYTLQSKCLAGLYYNCEEALEQDNGISACRYYVNPPAEAAMGLQSSDGTDTNWVSILSEAPGHMSKTGFERVEMYIKLNPLQLNLLPKTRDNAGRNRYEIWRITLLNDTWIIDATYMSNCHGYLPFFMGAIHDDQMEQAAKSPAEIIQPLQDFASFLLNTHVRATRKNIWGLTVYDRSVVDLSQIPEGEVSARVSARPGAAGKNIRDSIYEHSGQLDTKQTMGDLASVMDIIGQFFPTTSLPSQIASIDRAVDSQIAAVQQGANRRMQKGARLLDDTIFRPLRFCMYYNIIQFQPDDASVSDFYGRVVKIDLNQLRQTDLPYIIGQGLKALDRQAAAASLQTIIFALIQNPASAEQIDVLGLMNYWTNMIDVDIDLTQYQKAPPPAEGSQPGIGDNGGPPLDDEAAMAAAAEAQAGGPAIVPAFNPESVTQPMRGQ